jgi:hypothetical protein
MVISLVAISTGSHAVRTRDPTPGDVAKIGESLIKKSNLALRSDMRAPQMNGRHRANHPVVHGADDGATGELHAVLTWQRPPPYEDEGVAAHIFQLSIVALLPVGLIFLATADWKQPVQSVRRLAFPATAVVLAFSLLFYFEHVYFPAHGAPLSRAGLPLRLLRHLLGATWE